MRKKQVTILELATRLGLSPSTVSRALNGKHRISPSTQERVRRLAHELGYRPNVTARNLRENRTYTLGLMMPSLESRFHTLLLEAFISAARDIDHHIIIQIGHEFPVLNFLLNNHIDGILLFSGKSMKSNDLIRQIRTRTLPVVIIGAASAEASRVWIDDQTTTRSDSEVVQRIVKATFDCLFAEMEAIEQNQPFLPQDILC